MRPEPAVTLLHGASLPIGLVAAIAAALLASAGLVIQALDAREQEHHHGLKLSLLGNLLRTRRWVLGTVIGYLSFPFQLLALQHAPLIAVQPAHTAGLLLVLGAGARILHERVRWSELRGVVAIIVGLAILAWGSPSGSDSAVSPGLLGGVTAALLGVAVVPYIIRHCGRATLILSSGVGFAAANLAVKGFSDQLGRGHYGPAVGYLAAAAVGSIAAVLSQMTAFQRYRAVDVVPVTFALPIFLPTVLGIFILNEHWGTAAFAGAPFAVGAVLLALGTVVLTRAAPVVDITRQAASE